MNCPCCSGRLYSECCKLYHDGVPAPTALALMRSRYSAYSLGLCDYIIRTTHPKSPYFEKDWKKWEMAVKEFCETMEFLGLEIVGNGENWVHFIAHLGKIRLEEKSLFERVDGRWLYVKGDFTTRTPS